MTGLSTGQDTPTLAQTSAVIAWRGGAFASPRGGPCRTDWIERTMRRAELPSVVDLAKSPDTTRRLCRLLGL
jgi:hypothetical protein